MTSPFIKIPDQLVVFILDKQQFALSISAVNRIIRAIEITPLPGGPEIVLGIINLQGKIIPVVDIRKRFSLPKRGINLSDQIIIARTSRRVIGIAVNTVTGVIESPCEKIISPDDIVPGIEYIEGVVKFEDGLILIHGIDKFLSIEEEDGIDNAFNELNK